MGLMDEENVLNAWPGNIPPESPPTLPFLAATFSGGIKRTQSPTGEITLSNEPKPSLADGMPRLPNQMKPPGERPPDEDTMKRMKFAKELIGKIGFNPLEFDPVNEAYNTIKEQYEQRYGPDFMNSNIAEQFRYNVDEYIKRLTAKKATALENMKQSFDRYDKDLKDIEERNKPHAIGAGGVIIDDKVIPPATQPKEPQFSAKDAEAMKALDMTLGRPATPAEKTEEFTRLKREEQSGTAENDFKNWTEAEKKSAFGRRLLSKGETPSFGFGKAAAESRKQYEREYNAWLSQKDLSPGEAMAIASDVTSLNAANRQIENRTVLTNTFVNTIDKNSALLDKLRKDYGQNFGTLFNSALNLAKSKTVGSGDLEALRLVLISTSNELAKLESGSLGIAEVSVSQAEKMKKIHDLNLNYDDLKVVLDMGVTLGKIRQSGNKMEKDRIMEMLKKAGTGHGVGIQKPRLTPGEAIEEAKRRGLR